MVTEEKTKVANMEKVNAGRERESIWMICVLAAFYSRSVCACVFVCLCVCVCVDGRARASRCGLGNLPAGTQTQELPPDS